jgi:putative spermidine/putrescine transport system substrate-binding protein
MKKFATLLGAALMAGPALLSVQAWAADEVTVTSWGGAYQAAQRTSIFEPYTALGNKITEAEYNGEIAKIRAMVEAETVTWDVVSVDTQTVLAGCAEGVFETLDWGKLGLDRAKFLGADVTDCGLTTDLYTTVVAYDTTKTQPPANLFATPASIRKKNIIAITSITKAPPNQTRDRPTVTTNTARFSPTTRPPTSG